MGDLRHLGCNDETGCSRSLKRTIFSRRASNVSSNFIPPDRIDSHSSPLTSSVSLTGSSPIARTNRSNRGRRRPTSPSAPTIRFHLSAKLIETWVKDQNCYGMRRLYFIGKSYLFTVTTRGGVGVVDPTSENCCTHLNLTPL